MQPTILCIGLNHRTAPVALRERFGALAANLSQLLPDASVPERVLLNTCHRWELYVSLPSTSAESEAWLRQCLLVATQSGPEHLTSALYWLRNSEAAAHLLRVAAGLDSLVLGEPQILGQVIASFQQATAQHTAGPVLTQLFRAAIRAGKRTHRETTISCNPASLGSVAIAQAQAMCSDLRQREVLVIGAGEMAQQAIKALRARHIERLAVANRTQARAEALAAEWGGRAYALTQLPAALIAADVVVSATSAPHFVVEREWVATALPQRNGRPLVCIDIAAPRDIDPAVATLPGVAVVDIDHLQAELEASHSARTQEIPAVEAIVAQELSALEEKLQELVVRPVIAGLHNQAERIRQRELARTRRLIGPVDETTWQHIQLMSQALVNQLLHEPTLRLRAQAGHADSAEYIAAVRYLFNLQTPEDAPTTP